MKVLPDLLVLVSSVPDRDDVAALAASNVTIQIGWIARNWQKGKHELPSFEEEGSVLEITLDQKHGSVTIHIKKRDRGVPLHLYTFLSMGNDWEVIGSRRRDFSAQSE